MSPAGCNVTTMTRGKYAELNRNQREAALDRKVRELESELDREREGRRSDQLAFQRERSDVNKTVLDKTAKLVDGVVSRRIEEAGLALAATDLETHRVVMTRHLFQIFLSGAVEWDRLQGDVVMLSFLAAHGDLGEWFSLVDEHIFQMSRHDRRDRSRRNPVGVLLEIDRQVATAEDTTSRAHDRYLQMRTELNGALTAARDLYLSGKGTIPLPKGFISEDVTA